MAASFMHQKDIVDRNWNISIAGSTSYAVSTLFGVSGFGYEFSAGAAHTTKTSNAFSWRYGLQFQVYATTLLGGTYFKPFWETITSAGASASWNFGSATISTGFIGTLNVPHVNQIGNRALPLGITYFLSGAAGPIQARAGIHKQLALNGNPAEISGSVSCSISAAMRAEIASGASIYPSYGYSRTWHTAGMTYYSRHISVGVFGGIGNAPNWQQGNIGLKISVSPWEQGGPTADFTPFAKRRPESLGIGRIDDGGTLNWVAGNDQFTEDVKGVALKSGGNLGRLQSALSEAFPDAERRIMAIVKLRAFLNTYSVYNGGKPLDPKKGPGPAVHDVNPDVVTGIIYKALRGEPLTEAEVSVCANEAAWGGLTASLVAPEARVFGFGPVYPSNNGVDPPRMHGMTVMEYGGAFYSIDGGQMMKLKSRDLNGAIGEYLTNNGRSQEEIEAMKRGAAPYAKTSIFGPNGEETDPLNARIMVKGEWLMLELLDKSKADAFLETKVEEGPGAAREK